MDAVEKLGRYELLNGVAMGGMAEIFLARETGLAGFERLVIIKRVLPGLAEDIDFIDMFLDEARLAARLTHPNIVHIYELGEERGTYFIAMEYVPGGDLHEMLGRRRGVPLPLPDSLHIIEEVCAGLQFAHALAGPDGESLGVVHRDVTPKNVLLSVDGVVKVVDFGIAKARAKLSVTRPGDIKGTFSYMAPEQARGETVDRRADIYAVGALTYRLVTGTPAYPQVGDSLLSAVRASQFVRPRKINPDLPAAIEEVILRAMSLNPRDRYPTCGALRRELSDASRQLALHGDAESLSVLVRESFPDVPGVTVPADQPPEKPDPKSTTIETPLREGLQLASPDEATGLVSMPDLVDFTPDPDTDPAYSNLSPFDLDEEDPTDMVLLPEELSEADLVGAEIDNGPGDEPTHMLVPDAVGPVGPAGSQPFVEAATEPVMDSIDPRTLQSIAEDDLDDPTKAYVGPPSPLKATQPVSPVEGSPVEPASTPTGTPILRARRPKKKKKQRRGLVLVVIGFALGITLIFSALILFMSPGPTPTAHADTDGADSGAAGTPPGASSLIAATSNPGGEDATSSAGNATPPTEPDPVASPDAAPEETPAAEPDSGPAATEPIEDPPTPDPPAPDPPERLGSTPPPPDPPPPPPTKSAAVRTEPRPTLPPRVIKTGSKRSGGPTTKTAVKRPPQTASGGSKSSAMGRITVFTVPSSKVYLSGKLLGNSPIANRQVKAGSYTVKMVSPDHPNKTVRVQVKAGETTRVRQRL